jgi:hypothetical protein
LAPRGDAAAPPSREGVPEPGVAVLPTKGLAAFLAAVGQRQHPFLLDVGPAFGSNLDFLAERFGCRLFIEDLFDDIARFDRRGERAELPAFLETRLAIPEGTLDGILAWDLFDFLDVATARVLGRRLAALLRPGGVLLGFFATDIVPVEVHADFVILDERTLRPKTRGQALRRFPPLVNRDVARLFEGLDVIESFLLLTHTREMLFRKPAGARSC